MMRRARRFMALPRHERGLLLRARIQLTLTGVVLRIGGLRRASRLVDRLNPQPTEPPQLDTQSARVQRTVELVAAASRLGPEGTCLTRSLVVCGLLRRQGIASTLRMGVRREEDVEGHAWVEVAGEPINDTPDVAARYLPFPTDTSS